MTLLPVKLSALIGVLLLLALAVFVHSVHLREFDAALKVLRAQRFRQSVQEEITWRALGSEASPHPSSLDELDRFARTLGFDVIQMKSGESSQSELQFTLASRPDGVLTLRKTGSVQAGDVRALARLVEMSGPPNRPTISQRPTRSHPMPRVRLEVFRRLPLAIRCASTLIAVRAALVVLPLSKVRTFAAQQRSLSPRSVESAKDVAYMVRRTSGLLLRGNSCLIEALAVQYLLGREGISSNLRVGVLYSPERNLKGHAWLEQDGQILIGNYDSADEAFEVLPSFN